MNYYHICTEGSKDSIIFRDDEDYIAAMKKEVRTVLFSGMTKII